jgi:choline dehydrogenase
MAVVDHELRVQGLLRLRVADASIMPTVVSGNTNAGGAVGGTCRVSLGLAEAFGQSQIAGSNACSAGGDNTSTKPPL